MRLRQRDGNVPPLRQTTDQNMDQQTESVGSLIPPPQKKLNIDEDESSEFLDCLLMEVFEENINDSNRVTPPASEWRNYAATNPNSA